MSLCSGGAGLDIGVSIACELIGIRARIVGYVEREAYAAATIVARMEDAALDDAPIWDDVKTFDGKPWRGVVDCITTGYPCQPFSCDGKRLGTRDERHLWPDIDRIISEVEPGVVFLENVDDHLRLGFGVVRRDLQRRGYAVSAGLFTAAEVGATQQRQRLFILACASGKFGGGEQGPEGNERIGNSGTDFSRRGTVGDTERTGLEKRGCLTGNADAERKAAERASNGLLASPALSKTTRFSAKQEHLFGATNTNVPLFPPFRNDHETWQRVLAARPDLAPAVERPVCGMADGMAAGLDACLAYRTDRLRLTGNGVVPLAAAYAFLSLLAVITVEQSKCLLDSI